MLYYIKVPLILLICLVSVEHLAAHDPSQITYHFEKEGLLEIHLTPKGAIDLLSTIIPELEQQAVVNPNEYYDTFELYFNETIDLEIEGVSFWFSFLDADLAGHDAVMRFTIDDFAGDFAGYQLAVSSFTEVYRRVSNYVRVALPGENQICQLGQKAQTCTDISSVVQRELPTAPIRRNWSPVGAMGWVAGASFLAMLLFLYVKPK